MGWLNAKIDKSKREQRQEVLDAYGEHPLSEQFIKKILAGQDCDEVPSGEGPFGLMKNPIPVNGFVGEIMYLKRLRCSCGVGILFHRLGSTDIGTDKRDEIALDIFETVCLNGEHWNLLFLDLYHPRRSLKVPEGFTNATWDKVFSPLPIAFGTTKKVANYPKDLPKQLIEQYGADIGSPLSRKCSSFVSDASKFVPPKAHVERRNNYIATINGNVVSGMFQAIANMGDNKSDGVILF